MPTTVVLFLYGLAFFVTGALILAIPKGDGSRFARAIPFVGGFAVIHGVVEWFDIAPLVPPSTASRLVRVVLLIASYASLLRFGTRLLGLTRRTEWAQGALAVVLASIALARPSAKVTIEILARYSFCLSGAAVSAYALVVYARTLEASVDKAVVRRRMRWAAVTLGAYGILAGLIVPKAGLFPASLVNQQAFFSLVGVPIQEVRMICAVVLAVTLGTTLSIFNIEQVETLKRARSALEQHASDLESTNLRLDREIRERERAEARTLAVIDGAHEGIITLDPGGRIRRVNPAAEHMFGWSPTDVIGKPFDSLVLLEAKRISFLQWVADRVRPGATDLTEGDWKETTLLGCDGRQFPAECSIARRRTGDSDISVFVRDMSSAKRLEAELRQAQKLEAVGRLAAGIAHEINTPVQYVGDSIHFIRESVNDLLALLGRYRALRQAVCDTRGSALIPLATAAVAQEELRCDLEYLEKHLPKAVESALDGLSRVAVIVRGMKRFAHPDGAEKVALDLNEVIRNTLTLAHNEYKYVAELVTELGDVPTVMGHPGELGQALLNVLVNAAHAIADARQGETKGLITVRSWADAEYAVVSITDTGTGIPKGIHDKIFDPFFTTKEVGRGTGQGLSIARAIIVDKHQGKLTFDTEDGRGTTFFVRIPLNGRMTAAA